VPRAHADECHATGFFGRTGRGTAEYCGVEGKIDIINSTLVSRFVALAAPGCVLCRDV
jgi:7-keto-8-aminopelargonate synthetase-like enzyme